MAGIDSNALIVAHMDGTDEAQVFTDSSQYARTLTAASTARTDTSQFKFGVSSCLLDSGAAYVSAASAADLAFGTGDFTFDCWVRFISVPGVAQYIWAQDGVNTYVYLNATGFVTAWAASTYATQAWSPSTGTWYHIAMVKSGSNIYHFVDGTQIGSTITGVTGSSAQSQFVIGAYPAGGYFNGWMDEVRVSNVARWTSNFTPPTEAYSTGGGARLIGRLTLLGCG